MYFDACVAPYGAMAEHTLVPRDGLIDVPDEIDDVVAAALGNAGLAAWLSLTRRAGLVAGERVLVLGATGAVGAIAVQAAKVLGAGSVVAAGRASARLEGSRADRGAPSGLRRARPPRRRRRDPRRCRAAAAQRRRHGVGASACWCGGKARFDSLRGLHCLRDALSHPTRPPTVE